MSKDMTEFVAMSEEESFSFMYRPRLLVMVEGRHCRDFENEHYNPKIVRLWRYDLNRTGSVRKHCFWSELKTEYPHLSGEATGIGDCECVWRAEWSFPIMDAMNAVTVGNMRFSRCGAFREYTNNHEIPEGNLIWAQMRPL
ncbi:hypothetical protein ACQKJ1_23800 [Methylorubrum rhodesianum]|jgi:hypothetical protein|uniref:hypothetical protein n=1 Tax=Methylobacteriaceae TaxID=119045 RepID=UPI001F14186D|nr:hypothetical protein [Methylobacterium organophilum]UMY20296.1 hypothetical protein MMB17_24980 [Methylobacterium organophilum]